MVKYWDQERIRRVREGSTRKEARALQQDRERERASRKRTPGDVRKNTNLMLDALGDSLQRKMVARLVRGGAMSLSKLSEPYAITLPAALKRLRVLEDAGIVATHKQGRTRICVCSVESLRELGDSLKSKGILSALD